MNHNTNTDDTSSTNHVLYMINNPWYLLRKVGKTTKHGLDGTTQRVNNWDGRGWSTVELLSFDDADMLAEAEKLALYRLDQLEARDTERLQMLYLDLPTGWTEMYDPERYRGNLTELIGEELGVELSGVPSVRPLHMSSRRSLGSVKAHRAIKRNKERAAFPVTPARDWRGLVGGPRPGCQDSLDLLGLMKDNQ